MTAADHGKSTDQDVPADATGATGAEEPQETAAPQPGSGAGDPAAAAEAAQAAEEQEAQEVTDDLAKAQQDLAELTGDLQRLQAEYVNYKRRVDRDRELVKQNATFQVLSNLLPVLDDIDRAREHGELEGGFKAVADSLERIVNGLGLVKFGEPGDPFDPTHHEALMHAHSKEVTTTTCQTIVQAGYQIGDRVVRPARVVVVDPEPADESGAESDSPDAGPDAGDGATGGATQ